MNPPEVSILLIDPSQEMGSTVERPLREAGFQIATARTPARSVEIAREHLPNLAIKSYLPSRREKSAGLMEQLRQVCPDMQFIFISSSANVAMAMQAIRRGAFDCLPSPCEPEPLLDSVRRALLHQKLTAENPEILRRLQDRGRPNFLAGSSPRMQEIQTLIERVADTDVVVLVEGESGSGKELVARTLHEGSSRRQGPFVAVNCAALADSIIESELFGHVRGAFTGAIADKPGRFELARGGTLFLDEIADLSPLGQADLLRVLEDGIFRPVGSRTTARADARIIAATNRRLEDLCRQGRFREDLFYRLNVITISLPALRERPEDIPNLAASFVRHFCARHRRPLKSLSTELKRELLAFPWPGNVRQLRNAIERMVLVSPARTLTPEHLPPHLQSRSATPSASLSLPPGMTLAEAEAELIRAALGHCGGNRTEAARLLGISRRSLHYRLKEISLLPAHSSPG